MHVVECMCYAHIKHTIYSACTVMHALWDQIMQISKYASKPHYGNQDYDCACYTIYRLLSWANFLSTKFFCPMLMTT